MKKFFFVVLALILVACSPQVTVTPEATATPTPPPTSTPIPTPTLNPSFLAVQNFISGLNENLVLLPDGTIEELTADGGRQTIPNLHVDQYGVISIMFNNEQVVIEISQIAFDAETGLTIEGYVLENGEWAEAVVMSESDRQIFDAATELDGIKKELNKSWGVVGIDENGEMVKYWDYNEYNYDRGEWKEVVREENGHLVVMDSHGKEQIVYPERITINVNGEELVLNTTARNYLENKIPDTPGAKLEIAQELIRLSDEGSVLPKLAKDGMTLQDFWVKDYFNKGGIAAEMFTTTSTDWKERSADQMPSAYVLFPHVVDGFVVSGAYETFVQVLQSDGTTSGYWVIAVNDIYDELPYPQQVLDHDMFGHGGNSALLPIRYISEAACVEVFDREEMNSTCQVAMADVPTAMQAVRRSVASGMVDPRLLTGELEILAYMGQVAR